tara:strand:- start:1572 stop:2876 length:1305 start_codon:yes stop_codon:yes gene_type:complete
MASGRIPKIIQVILIGVFIVVLGSSVVSSADSDDFCDSYTELYSIFCQYIPPESLEVISSEPEENPDSSGSQEDPRFSLPECSLQTKLTIPPLNIDDYEVIAPLGNLNPPGHTLPTDHIYYYLTRDDVLGTVKANIYAPGDIRIFSLDFSRYFIDGVEQYIDYTIIFPPCRDQTLRFGHVRTLNTQLLEILNNSEVRCGEVYGLGPETYQYCWVDLALDVEAGTILGTAGGFNFGSWALDLWAFDLSTPPLQYTSSMRYGLSLNDQSFHVVCPLDLFTDEVRQEQESKVGLVGGNKRTIEPICGEVMQDISGTAQGNWFAGEDLTDMSKWDKHLAFVHDNFDPAFSAISIGGTVMDSGVWLFMAENNGTINRQFSDVTPDGKKYCYDATANSGYNGFPGFLIIQLLSTTEWLVEHGNGICELNVDFVNPITYHR